MGDLVEQFTDISRRDDCFDYMVPSDVRLMLGEIRRLRETVDVLVTVFAGDKRLDALAMVDGATKEAIDRATSLKSVGEENANK